MAFTTRAAVSKSYLLWRGREVRYYRTWRKLVKTQPVDSQRRKTAFGEYEHARDMRRKREAELDKFLVSAMSDLGRRNLIVEEGKRNKPYNDSEGYATVGVGHLLHRSPVTSADVRKWTLTDREVDALLAKDLRVYESAVRKAVKKSKVKITQAMFDAMVSLCFNIGAGAFAGSSVVRFLKAGNKRAAADAFLMWDHPAVLRPRRERERKAFLS